jgi:uncharacterized protein YecT (DUF1311 family)
MKTLSRPNPVLATAFLVTILVLACESSEKKAAAVPVVQDTMLLHDLAQANRNTAATDIDTTIPVVVRSRTESENDGLVSVAGGPSNAGQILTPSGSQPRTSGGNEPRIAPPRRARDAPAPTSVATSNVTPAIGDPCDSPAADDQRTCLNRAIARSDVNLNRVYQELIAQARISGGPELEERFRVQQRAWIRTRDEECRARTRSEEGELWAPVRGRCLGEYSSRRTAALQESLNSLRGQ